MALLIFIITLLLIYFRPFGIPIWVFSILGSLCAYLFGIVNLNDIYFVWNMTWDSSFTLIGLIIFTISLERIGFFNFLANYIIKLSMNKDYISVRKFYILIVFFSFIVSALFSNDGAILILTPLIIALFNTFDLKQDFIKSKYIMILFLLVVSFVADFGSNLFVFSNLTNIITAHAFSIPFLSFFSYMLLPQIFVLFSTLIAFWILFMRRLPKYIHFSVIDCNIPSKFSLFICFILIITLVFGIMFGDMFEIPISFIVLFVGFISSLISIMQKKSSIKHILSDSPFSVVVFSVGLFIVVYSLKYVGIIDMLQNIINEIYNQSELKQILFVAFGSGIGSSIINNLPMVMLGDLALKEANSYLIYAHLLGCNIGSKLTPIGSLATLLWLVSLKRYNINISFFYYAKIASFVTIVVLFSASIGLYFSLFILYF